MNFDSLPSDLLLQIVSYLPFKEKFRIARVSRRLNDVSKTAIQETKSLVLNNDVFQYSVWRGFATFLDLCSPKLKEIAIENHREDHVWMKILAQYSFPQLEKFAIKSSFPTGQRVANYCGGLISRCPKLKWLELHSEIFPAVIVLENLETLIVRRVTPKTLSFFRGIVPGLRHLTLGARILDPRGAYVVDAFKLDADPFFACVPNLEGLHIDYKWDWGKWGALALNASTHFWKLPSLTNLKILDPMGRGAAPWAYGDNPDTFLKRISVSFLHLEQLHLEEIDVSGEGISAVAALASLRELRLSRRGYDREFDEFDSIERLTKCVQLRQLFLVDFVVTRETIISLLSSCPELRNLGFYSIIRIERSVKLIDFLKSLAAVEGRQLNMWFRGDWFVKICICDLVKSSLDEIADFGGPRIRIRRMPTRTTRPSYRSYCTRQVPRDPVQVSLDYSDES